MRWCNTRLRDIDICGCDECRSTTALPKRVPENPTHRQVGPVQVTERDDTQKPVENLAQPADHRAEIERP